MHVSRDPAARRRLLALALAALLAAGVGMALGARDERRSAGRAPPDPKASSAVTHQRARVGLTPAQQAGQLLVLRFAGTSAPAYVRRALREGRAAGVVLFADNVESPAQLRLLTRQLQRAARGGALVCVDQEGGSVRNVPWAGPDAAQPAQSTPALAAAAARQTARDLRAIGVNVNLAPVADVPSGPASVMGGRAFAGAPAEVAELVRAAVNGYRRGRVAATVKHFPGLGSATANTDDASVSIVPGPRDLEPFRAAIAARAPLLMASHALYPKYDRERIASQSPAVLHSLLRGKLRFKGAVMTDSLEAAAVTARSSVETAGLRSVEAGADLLLTTGRGSYARVHRRLVARARAAESLRLRMAEAQGRVLRLKRGLGLRTPEPADR